MVCRCVHSLIFVVAKIQSLGTWYSLDVSLLLWYPVYFMITYSSILACYWAVLRYVGSDVFRTLNAISLAHGLGKLVTLYVK